jgi:hypothetical protein
VLFGYLCKQRIPVDPAGPEPLWTRPPILFGLWSPSFAATPVAATAAISTVTAISTIGPATASAAASFALWHPLGGHELILTEGS